ncbi:RAD51-associated protein 1 isoform X2 [Apodemus sylvaticus]|uniref:RAD51-associated protein 1 isoform X2 n=1 Tax=Apodemus sylvaticus TaxID=10129 RepID=UPI0022438474|nr:RAD51-associated protein 1 isoform X2 [Apodemus sylvaticus]
MARPTRNKKPVNYSQFEDSGNDSDDDFISSSIPVKKSKTVPKVLNQDKPKPNLKNLQKEEVLSTEPPKKRVALDDKVFQRGLEVALALSVKELPTLTNQVKKSEEKSNDKQGKGKTEKTDKPPRVSNCSVTSDDVDLDKITEEGDSAGVEGEAKATSKARAQQRRVLPEGGGGGGSANDTEPESATGEDSESDPDFDESEESDEDFGVRRSKETKKKTVQKKPAGGKKERKSKPKLTSVDPAPAAIKSGSPPLPQAVGLPSEAARKPAIMCSPSSESKRPKWVPPAASGSRNSSSSASAGTPAKSPSQSLRLGLSRLAPVKHLHPSATSSQVR